MEKDNELTSASMLFNDPFIIDDNAGLKLRRNKLLFEVAIFTVIGSWAKDRIDDIFAGSDLHSVSRKNLIFG